MSEITNQHEINQSYWFKWNDYQNHLSDVVRQLLEEDCMVDVTLAAGGERIHAHRIVLCACSTLFREILSQVNEDHPTIILSDISAQDIKSIIEFTYHGEVRVPVENISTLLDAARSLKICGLIEIDGLEETDSVVSNKDFNDNNEEPMTVISEAEENVINALQHSYEDLEDQQKDEVAENSTLNKKKKRRRDTTKRDYSEDMLAAAINDLKAGQTLIEASTKHNIPRSTLYMRAKALGIHLNASRNEYPAECMKAAINAVIGGSSLQHASELFSIPKTVLWRRIQKEGYQILRSEMKRSYGSDKREAAVKALERGENLTKVALEFKIPKTTLFRDKARLVDEGKLPLSFWKKRKTENEELKKSRLEEAVAACKGGKMSQAAASMTYHIPKTTIWRRLQQDGKKSERSLSSRKQRIADSKHNTETKVQEGSDFTYCEVSSEIPITYIDENSIPEDSVIILTAEDMDGLNLEEGRQIIVNSESGQEYVPCAISIEENSNYSQTES
ncbi:protein abrupt-like [Bombus affinis]|uniref:Protein abrupt n=1 Tax=Bombus terrestris TaxID=30195 RepID=A0A9B0BPH8_BOMTE|nr:protein abrupt [Bombus terrestris]XP_050585263.1 protein abrupt-like [Bombus affinis]